MAQFFRPRHGCVAGPASCSNPAHSVTWRCLRAHTRYARQPGLVIHVDMAPRVAVIAAVLAVALVGVAAADDLPRFDLGSSWTPTPESFAKWMSEGGEAWTGEESVPEMRQKFIRRVLSWATDEITDVKHDVRGVDARRCLLPCVSVVGVLLLARAVLLACSGVCWSL